MTEPSLLVSPNSDKSNILLIALRYLAQRCDGAEAKDGAGFNKPDSWLGKKLAERDYLTEDETVQAFQMLPKYTAQLEAGGITLPEREPIIAAAKQADQERGIIVYNDITNLLIVKFPYNQQHVAKVKTIDKARFNGDGEKFWTVPLSSGKKLLEVFPGFTITDEAKDAIATWEPPKFIGKIVLAEKFLNIYFEYDPAIVATVKAIKGAKFNDEGNGLKYWTVPIDQAGVAINTLINFETGPGIRERIEADRLVAELQAAKQSALSDQLSRVVDFSLPSGRTPFKHQREAVDIMLKKLRAILADDMGLGKSLSALIAAKAFNLSVIVICPASLRINWQREADFAGVKIVTHSWSKIPKPPGCDYVLIADEAHYAQNYKSLRTKAFLALALDPHCMGCYPLTGTPIKNGRPVNLYPLLKAIRHPLAEDKSGYERRYCNAHPTRFTQWDTSGASHLDELHEKLKDVMIRRMKKDCLDLPEKTRVIRAVELSDKAQKAYDEKFEALRAEYHKRMADKGQTISQAEAIVMLNNVRHASSFAKVETALDLAEEVIEEGGSIVLFVAFKEPGELIAKALGVPFFHGELDGKKRQAIVDDFQAHRTSAFVGTLQAGGVGITLTAAQTVILVDRPWTPGDAIQSEDRLHRIGQANAVTSIWLQCGAADIEIDEILQEKQERIDLVLTGKRKTMRGTGSVGELAQAMLPLIMEE